MNIRELETPAILVLSGALQKNLEKYQKECDRCGKELWPMVKTHKSIEIADMQFRLGATGFLCGTLDECEMLCAHGGRKLMYAYPVAGLVSCRRAAKLAKQCEFYVRLDSLEAAADLDREAAKQGIMISYTAILDCGLHRFGLPAEQMVSFVDGMKQFENLHFAGISTHCGHVYGEAQAANVPRYAEEEKQALHKAVDLLREAGYRVEMVTSGATPTFFGTVEDPYINIYHPGNYVFQDCIQLANKTAVEEECALLVYATVISRPRKDLLICDAGAKCLGLDQGAHGNTGIAGYGSVIGHPELLVASLSEEVGKIKITGETDVKIGDRIMIIPNHACSSANLTNYYVFVDENMEIERLVTVDMRGNSTPKGY